MSQGLDLRRGGFQAPRVPFDLRCVILAALGYATLYGVDYLLGKSFDTRSPIAQLVWLIATQVDHVAFMGTAFRRGMHAIWGTQPHTMTDGQTIITAVSFLAVWSLFGAAVMRTAALRLTRDDPLSLKEALVFGGLNWWSFLRAPLLVIGFAAFFIGCIMLAGAVISIPLLGSWFLVLLLFPLVLVAGVLVVLALLGGLVGLPLMWSGIVVEQNGPLEALSRAFSYIFARPFRFFFNYFLLFVVMSLLLVVADRFEVTTKQALQWGVWRSDLDDSISKELPNAGEFEDEFRDTKKARRQLEGIGNLDNIKKTHWFDWVGFAWMWLFLTIFMVGFKGYALYVFLGGTVSLYLQLRREVDGTDEEEIYPESEQELVVAEGADPRWVGGAPDEEAAAAAEEEKTGDDAPPKPEDQQKPDAE